MLELDFSHLTWTEVKEAVDEGYVLFLPVGTVEEHGPHLPVFTDAYFAQHWAKEAAVIAREDYGIKVLVLPPICYGESLIQSSFPGTISLKPKTLAILVFDIVDAVLKQGFRKVVIVNVHGGNRPALNCAVREVKAKYHHLGENVLIRIADDTDEDLLPQSFWDEASKIDSEASERHMLHGGSLETAKMLSIAPSLVKKEMYPSDISIGHREDIFFMEEISPLGIEGNPSQANAELGKMLWSQLIRNLAEYARKISSNGGNSLG